MRLDTAAMIWPTMYDVIAKQTTLNQSPATKFLKYRSCNAGSSDTLIETSINPGSKYPKMSYGQNTNFASLASFKLTS
jgi:hypothetical protein